MSKKPSNSVGPVQILFKAQGTFKGSKPTPNSPYQTATPFFSSAVLGQQVWPGHVSIESIHHRLSVSLNDRHKIIGIIGDWRDTHGTEFGGFWSYRVERFRKITENGKTRNEILSTEYVDSSNAFGFRR
jgi:hypothetical protein